MVFTEDAFQAAAAFNAQKEIAGCVSWAPDIYNLSKIKGNRLLVTTQEANRLIADVWFARADFARDHAADHRRDRPRHLRRDGAAQGAGRTGRRSRSSWLPATTFPPADALSMLGDAHSTNWAENFQFFINENNPTNFERIWQRAYLLYRRIGSISHRPVPFDQVMDFSIIQKLGQDAKYASSEGRVRIEGRSQGTAGRECRGGGDPDQHGRDPLLPQ